MGLEPTIAIRDGYLTHQFEELAVNRTNQKFDVGGTLNVRIAPVPCSAGGTIWMIPRIAR